MVESDDPLDPFWAKWNGQKIRVIYLFNSVDGIDDDIDGADVDDS